MILTETLSIVNKRSTYYNISDELCFPSKNQMHPCMK